mmetsp:Transcript_34393/g.97428  ORF Transcript_34393/g.97428 Transcript_34393/m.97428 type:complete len:226 (+) Transcript_34393:337-1014(+)
MGIKLPSPLPARRGRAARHISRRPAGAVERGPLCRPPESGGRASGPGRWRRSSSSLRRALPRRRRPPARSTTLSRGGGRRSDASARGRWRTGRRSGSATLKQRLRASAPPGSSLWLPKGRQQRCGGLGSGKSSQPDSSMAASSAPFLPFPAADCELPPSKRRAHSCHRVAEGTPSWLRYAASCPAALEFPSSPSNCNASGCSAEACGLLVTSIVLALLAVVTYLC